MTLRNKEVILVTRGMVRDSSTSRAHEIGMNFTT